MPIIPLTCPNCGGNLSVDSTLEAAICSHCKKPYIVKDAIVQNYITNVTNITADTVNVYSEKDFEVKGGKLIKYNGESMHVEIPDSVRIIGGSAFADMPIESVVIPDSVLEMGSKVFQGCKYLKKARLSEKLKSIPDSTFLDCEALISVNIPQSVTNIGSKAFFGCVSLPSLNLSKNIERIGSLAFNGCSSLISINDEETFPGNVSEISDGTFSGCSSLSHIHLPANVESIGSAAFASCKTLKAVTVNEGLKTIREKAFFGCESLESFTVPVSVEKIETGAFGGCTGLKKMRIAHNADLKSLLPLPRLSNHYGNGQKTLSGGAFWDCNSLSEIEWYGKEVPHSKKQAFFERVMGDSHAITFGADWLKRFAGTAFFRNAQISFKSCTYCGGAFTGMVSKTCIECGRPKDY